MARIILTQKTRITMAVILLLVAIFSLGYLLTYDAPTKGNEYFTEQPETWIEDRYETSIEGDFVIDVHKATRSRGLADVGRFEYHKEGDITTFFYKGFYKGERFSSLYSGDTAYLLNLTRGKSIVEQTAIAEENAIMRIDSALNPNDGVIDSFVLAREEEGRFVFYIFVDEDWRKQVKFTNILWGDDFRGRNTLNIQEFDFSNNENGIYINKLDEDVGWNDFNPVKGGLMVGEIDYRVLDKLLAYEEFDETFIMVR